jgi:hypothetical protein
MQFAFLKPVDGNLSPDALQTERNSEYLSGFVDFDVVPVDKIHENLDRYPRWKLSI